MSGNDLKDFNKKMALAVEQYAALGGIHVEVGLPGDKIHGPSGLPLSELGAIHEFGYKDIPERSFLRGAVSEGEDEIKGTFEVLAKKSLKGESAKTLMEQFAIFGKGLVQEYIANGEANFAPLAKPRKDGSSNPLNDSGELRQGIEGITIKDGI